MKRFASILSIFLSVPFLVAAQGEYDDLYYTPSDREEAIASYQASAKVYNQAHKELNDYSSPSYEKADDRIYNTTQGRTVNPEYTAQYRSRADARSQQDDEVYFDEEFDNEVNYSSQQPVINNHYYGNSWSNPVFYDPYDPYYSDYWRWRNDWRWRRAAYYDPFYDPYWGSGWSVSISIGWNSWGRWGHYRPYRPYYSSWSYGGFYDPYWYGGGYSPVYYQNVYIVDNENNSRIRRGRAVSRGSVVSNSRGSATRGRIEEGPVSRVSTSRSTLSNDRDGRSSSASSRGRVINTSTVSTRSAASRDYSDVLDRNSRNSSRSEVNGLERNSNVRSRMSNSDVINRSNTTRSEPTRSYERPSNNTRSNETNYRSTTPSRNREYVPQRNQNNNRSISVPRSNGNNSRSSDYKAPQRSNNSGYNRSSSGSSNRSSSVGTSRSSSSSRSSSPSPSRSSSGSRRGGN